MEKIRIIPCLDVKAGRVVKGVNFVNLRDAGDPVSVAAAYNDEGADELCFLDITASHEYRDTLLHTVTKTAEVCFMPLTVGGGVRGIADVVKLLRAGADKVAINSAAVADPKIIRQSAEEVGSQCIVAAIDARKVDDQVNKWEIYTHGGRKSTGIDAIEYAKIAQSEGAGEILLTSMDADGTKQGYDIELTSQVAQAVDLPIIASGGAGSISDMIEVVKYGNCTGVLAASVFHFGEIKISDVKQAMLESGIKLRPPEV